MTGGAEVDQQVAALKLEYEYIQSENRRLRDGRGQLTRQLGPLPLGAAIVAGLVTGFSADPAIRHDWLLGAAGMAFVLMVGLSIAYSSMKPYRKLREDAEQRWDHDAADSTREWYEKMIGLESQIYLAPRDIERRLSVRLVKWTRWQRLIQAGGWFAQRTPSRSVADLQEGYDRERSGLFTVQFLFAV